MTIGIDFVGTNYASGTKTYNINFCNTLNKLELNQNIKIFICKNYLDQITIPVSENNKIEYVLKPNFLSIRFFRILWMQLIFPIEIKLLGIKKIYSPMGISPLISKLLNIKIVLCLHSNLPWVNFNFLPGGKIRNVITKKLMELSIYNCDILIVNSFYAKNEIRKILNLYQKKIEFVYLNISEKFYSLNRKKNFLDGFDYKQKYILSVTSCVRYHNIINLLISFKILIKEINFDIKLVLILQILDEKYFLEIKDFILKNFENKEIIIYTNLDSKKLPDFYKYAELYTFTSYIEVFGLTSLEAMSQETPVAISDRSALTEINGDAAIYYDPDDINQIKNSLKKILLDENLKKKLILAGKKRIMKFDAKTNTKKTINIIENLV